MRKRTKIETERDRGGRRETERRGTQRETEIDGRRRRETEGE